jgi:hypothetical protein
MKRHEVFVAGPYQPDHNLELDLLNAFNQTQIVELILDLNIATLLHCALQEFSNKRLGEYKILALKSASLYMDATLPVFKSDRHASCRRAPTRKFHYQANCGHVLG